MLNITYIVGDAFIEFANKSNIITISSLETMLQCPRIGKARNGLYICGQGVPMERLANIKQQLKDKKIDDIILQESGFVKE